METTYLPNPKTTIKGKRETRPVRHTPNGLYIPIQSFRVSKLNFKPKVAQLDTKSLKLLFALNQIHNQNFNPNQMLNSSEVSGALVNGLKTVIPFDNDDFFINLKMQTAVISQSLEFDFYIMQLKPFFKLKYKAPILFEGFKTLVKHLGVPIAEQNDTPYFDEEFLTCYDNYTQNRGLKNAYKTVSKKLGLLDNALSKKNSLNALKTYKPRNPLYIKIKTFLINYIGYNASTFLNNYPLNYFKKEKTEILELFNRCFFCYDTDSKLYNEIINSSVNSYYANYLLDQPCSIIDADSVENNTADITYFEDFNISYIELAQELQNQ